MRLTNVGFIGPNPTMSEFAHGPGGLSGLGDIIVNPDGSTTDTGTGTMPSATPWYTDPKTITAINSEALFGANLFRGLMNQAPLPAAQFAPQVAVGLNAETSKLLMLGAVGLAAVFLLKGRKRR